MARKLRIDYPGAWHHVMHRGASRQATFLEDGHYILFLKRLAETSKRFDLEVHAYALMPNHYHLLVRSKNGNLSHAMRHLNATYTQDINTSMGWDGALFLGRFRSQNVEQEPYLLHLLAYIHLNPIQAGLAQRLDAHCWTSHRAYLGRETVPEWLTTTTMLDLFGGRQKLQTYVQNIRTKARALPDDIGLISSPKDREAKIEPDTSRFLSKTAVMRRVCEITAQRLSQIMKSAYGRGANPARRFAVWSLANHTQLTQREIGDALKMSTAQVALILFRLGKEQRGEMPRWINAWDAQKENVL